jgi:signal transduction histidine kinase/CheY-like chemotaxis protein
VKQISSVRVHQLLVIASLLVPAILFVLAAAANRADVVQDATDSIERTSVILHEHARKVFETADLAMARVEDKIRGESREQIASPATSAFLAALKEPMAQAVSMWVSDLNGVVLAGSQEWDRTVTLRGREFFEVPRSGAPDTHVSAPFVGKATRTASFALSRPWLAADGSLRGAFHVALSPDYFARFFSQSAPPFAHFAALIRADGTILAREPAEPGETMLRPDNPLLREIALRPDGGVFNGRAEDGAERIVAYRKIAGYPVYVEFGADRNVVLQRWYKHLTIYGAFAAAGAATLLLTSLLALRRAFAEEEALAQLRHENEQRIRAEQQLQHAQRLEAVGQLTGGVAHDFNNLLTAILGNLELIERAAVDNARIRRLAAMGRRAAERGASLTASLLAFSRRQRLQTESVDANQLIRDLLGLVRQAAGDSIRVVCALAPHLAPCRADAGQLEAAILNLVLNARDALPNGGTLRLATQPAMLTETDLAHNPEARPGAFVAISVQDGGIGMAPDVAARAFEPFFTTKEVGKGTGLGLSQVFGFTRQLGGHATIDSAPGQGTTVTLYLPCAAAVATSSDTTGEAGAPRLEVRVLLVEDDPDVLAVARSILEDAGCEVVAATGVAQALALLEGDPGIGMLVSDIAMPGGGDGVELARQARALRPGLPVLLATGYAPEDSAVAHEFRVIGKPYHRALLMTAVREALQRQPA